MFQNKEYLGQYVDDLTVYYASELDDEAISSVQTLFPKIKKLKWQESWMHSWLESEDLNDPGRISPPQLTSILLLQKPAFLFLRDLELNYDDVEYVENGGTRIDSIIAHLNNVPALQVLSIKKAQFILEDMEYLHTALPQLQELNLGSIDISIRSAINEISISPASNLKSLCFGLDTESFEIIEDEQAVYIIPWIRYFGEKYGNLEFFNFIYDYHGREEAIDDIDLEQTLMNMISNMPHLTTYNMALYTLTPNILRAMDQNNIKLNNITLWNSDVEQEHIIPNDYRRLVSSTSTRGVETVVIKQAVGATFSTVSNLIEALIITPNCLTNLVNLRFDIPYSFLSCKI